MKALVLVDIQNDFFSGGALPVSGAEEIIPLIDEMIRYPFDRIVATKDWHPFDHVGFASNHRKKPGEHIRAGGTDQILWPVHCVQGTSGSEFAPGWDTTRIDKVVYKGTDSGIDSYSAFYDNEHLRSTGLENDLREKSILEVVFAGLTTDYCVKYSVIDALESGFKAYVIVDACRGVNLKEGDEREGLALMRRAGAVLLSFKDLKHLLVSDKSGKGL